MSSDASPLRRQALWAVPWASGLRRALVVTRREVRETMTDWRVLFPMLTLTLLFPALLVGVRGFEPRTS